MLSLKRLSKTDVYTFNVDIYVRDLFINKMPYRYEAEAKLTFVNGKFDNFQLPEYLTEEGKLKLMSSLDAERLKILARYEEEKNRS